MAVKKQPWAVLVCRFSDDKDPAKVLVRDLPALENPDPNDQQTVLDLFRMFFTKQGNNTFNAVRFFNEISHGSIDLNDSQVFVVNLNMTKAQADAIGINPGGSGYQSLITQAAQTAAIQQGVPLQNFYGIVITSHYFLAMAQGGPIPGGGRVPNLIGWAGMDYRWVKDHGTQSWGQEMGHGYGLDHSRIDGNPADYMDSQDIMSTRAADSGPDPNYGFRGPGLNAWNMRGRGWLDESRVWHCPNRSFAETLQLRPLHRKDLPGFLAAELPPMNDTGGFPRYLVEYRIKENWDSAIPGPCILVHRFEGAIGQFMDTHSYVMRGTGGQVNLGAGDTFDHGAANGINTRLDVLEIDANSRTATVRLSCVPVKPPLGQICVGQNADGRLETLALGQDTLVYHIRQTIPNGGWLPWSALGGHDIRQLAVGRNADGRLELFALGGDGAIYHIWQTAPNGNWGQWSSLPGHDIQQMVVGNNADGRLELFALGADRAVYHIWQTSPNGLWGQWSSLFGQDLQQIAVARNADGRLELFALGGDTAVYHVSQTAPNANWGQWFSLFGHDIRQFAIGRNADGRLELFALGGDRAIYHSCQTAPGGNWGQWSSLAGHDIQQIVVGNNADGRQELFALGADRTVSHICQTSPNGLWGQWSSLTGQDIQQIALGSNADGRLELFALGGDHFLYHRGQTVPNGQWANWSSSV